MKAYSDHVEFETVKLPFFPFELDTNGAHFFRGNSLIEDMLVEGIDNVLADIYTNEELGVTGDLSRKES